MLKYFRYSFVVTVIGLLAAFLWGQFHAGGVGVKMLLIALFLAILEVTLSFDNAIVNALRLEKMSPKWQQCFLTWGILIAVFGMRLVFPVLIVSVFAHKSMLSVFEMALNNIELYNSYLSAAHAPLVTFGGIFLLLIFLNYFFVPEKEVFWLKKLEGLCSKIGHLQSFDIIVSLFAICVVSSFVEPEIKLSVIFAGIGAVLTFLIINGITEALEKFAEQKNIMATGGKLGFIGFLYLELIDASFSFDGLLGAFAISQDIIIITIGLAIGAMFVRSLTLFMVDKKTLKSYIYLEHGAHWAIGYLAMIMLFSTKIEIREFLTGGISLIIIIAAFLCSIAEQKKLQSKSVQEICEK